MGNSAKLAVICSGVKKYGHDAGSANIFVFFGNESGNMEKYCLVEQTVELLGRAVSVDEAHEIVTRLCAGNPRKNIYFCGAHPLARYDWIERLYNKQPGLDFCLYSKLPDAQNLAKILHVVDTILVTYDKESDKKYEWEQFITLAKFRKVYLNEEKQ